jgi:hypothetical protein
VWPRLDGGAMGTMFNLLPWEVVKGICDAEAGLCL